MSEKIQTIHGHSLDPKIYKYFCMADTNKNGSIDFYELQNALKNDANSNFRSETVRLMISMFKVDF